MSVKSDLYRQVMVRADSTDQMTQFILQSSIKSYMGEMRRQLRQAGYPDRSIVIDDPATLATLEDQARIFATSIRNTYNQFLHSAINKLPASVSRGGALQALAPFIAKTRSYNTTALFPYIAATCHEQARHDFITRNGIQCKWRLVGPTPPEPDVCARDLARGPVDDFNGFESERGYPAHPHCLHKREAIMIVTASLPDKGAVWAGQNLAA